MLNSLDVLLIIAMTVMACTHGKHSFFHCFRLKPPGYPPIPGLCEPVANPSRMSLIQPAPAVLGPLPLPATKLIPWAWSGLWVWRLGKFWVLGGFGVFLRAK